MESSIGMGTVLFLIIAVIILYLILRTGGRKVGAVNSNWSRYFDKLQFSAKEFYAAVEKFTLEREIPDIKITRVQFTEGSILSKKRIYLRIERKDDIFDIFAAPFGTGFFVSYWLGEPTHGWRDFLMNIPILKEFVGARQSYTYYQADTAGMFKLCVKDAVREAIEHITAEKRHSWSFRSRAHGL